MENEMGPFLFSELSHMPMNSKTQMLDTMSSWLNLDDIYTPAFLEELPDFPMLDDQLFQFAMSDHQTHDPNYTNDSFLLDPSQFETDIDTFQPILSETCVSAGSTTTTIAPPSAMDESEIDRYLNYNTWLVEPAESYESFTKPVLGSVSGDTTEMGVNLAISEKGGMVSRNEEDGDEEEETDEERKPSMGSSKNLLSERNRRKRLSRQLLALRALVPNITKMDKRSVLVDALAYLSSIHEEISRIKTEFQEQPSYTHNNTTLTPQRTLEPPSKNPKPKSQILEIDAEKIEDFRFVVKITCKGDVGVGGEVLRVIESLGFEITYTALDKIKPMLMLTTVFIRVRKQGKMTEEKLKDCITSTALGSGLMLKNP